MDSSQIIDMPFVNSVTHPYDFSLASERAYVHALAIALLRKTKFTILHAGPDDDRWRSLPAVRSTLERWGLLEKESPRSAVFDELAVRVNKVGLKSRNPLKAVLEYLAEHPSDLVVLATHGREGMLRLMKPSFAERIAQKSKTMTLFVPGYGRGFVSPSDGTFSLQRILVPIDFSPSPLPAIEYATRLARAAGNSVEINLFHVSSSARVPALDLSDGPSYTWKRTLVSGEPVAEIARAAGEYHADLLIMSTAGHRGFLDALRGSVTDQIVRQASCPVLAVPELLLEQGKDSG